MKLFITSNSNVGLRVAECSCQYFFSISCSYTNFSCQNTPTKTKMSTNRLFRAELCLSANSDQIYIYKYVYIYESNTHNTQPSIISTLNLFVWPNSQQQSYENANQEYKLCVFFSFFLCLFNLLVRLCYTVSVCWWYSYWWCWRWLPISALAHIHTLSHPFHSWLCFQPVQ